MKEDFCDVKTSELSVG